MAQDKGYNKEKGVDKMNVLVKSRIKEIFKGKCWLKEKTWGQLDQSVTEMLEDVANIIRTQHIKQERRKATVEDIEEAVDIHSKKVAGKTVVELGNKLRDIVVNAIEEQERDVNAYYGGDEQTTLSKRAESN